MNSSTNRIVNDSEPAIRINRQRGLKIAQIENELIRVSVLTEIGGKIIELTNKLSGYQWFLEPQNSEKWYNPASYGADFSLFDTSGYDDCFPTVSACSYLSNGSHEQTSLPDHGEIWSRPCELTTHTDFLSLTINGVAFPYHFEKRISLQDNALHVEYFVKNLSEAALPFLFAAHPLLKVREGSIITLPDEVNSLFLNWSSDEKIGSFGDTVGWPFVHPDMPERSFAVAQPPSFGRAVKLFTGELSNGTASIIHPDIQQELTITFDTEKLPYLGIWLSYGGWPDDGREKHFTVALEPTNGRPDSLADAINRKECTILNPAEEISFSIVFTVS